MLIADIPFPLVDLIYQNRPDVMSTTCYWVYSQYRDQPHRDEGWPLPRPGGEDPADKDEDQTMSSPDSVEGLFEVQTTTNQHVDDRHSLESYVELCTDSVPRTVTVFRRNSSQTICLNILSRYFVVHGIIYIRCFVSKSRFHYKSDL